MPEIGFKTKAALFVGVIVLALVALKIGDDRVREAQLAERRQHQEELSAAEAAAKAQRAARLQRIFALKDFAKSLTVPVRAQIESKEMFAARGSVNEGFILVLRQPYSTVAAVEGRIGPADMTDELPRHYKLTWTDKDSGANRPILEAQFVRSEQIGRNDSQMRLLIISHASGDQEYIGRHPDEWSKHVTSASRDLANSPPR